MLDVLMVGVGQCGGRILDQINKQAFGRSSNLGRYVSKQNWPSNVETIVINTAVNDLKELRFTKAKDRIHIPHLHGVGANREEGKNTFRENERVVMDAIERRGNFDVGFVFTSVGGGTGSSFTPLLADKLKYLYDIPIYVFTVLPFREEGSIYMQNSAFCLRELRESSADSMILVDNAYLGSAGDNIKAAYDGINKQVARRVLFLMNALDSEMLLVTDLGDFKTTMRGGDKIATMGFAESTGEGAISNAIKRAISRAGLLFPADVYDEAARAMLVIKGDRNVLNLSKIKEELDTLSSQVGQVFKGVVVEKGAEPQVLSVLSLSESEELDRLYERAVQAVQQEKDRRKSGSKAFSRLDGLEPEY
ncbi:MAG: Tubulin-like protein CetZ [Methanonatronarchaeales archaeon]|nr:Tubulin-like protein CetZ [Methanonatronarchaeales archaeon]